MPKASVHKSVQIDLSLTEEEARYLKDLLQNYMGDHLDNEPDKEREMRFALFHSLKDSLEQ